MKINKELILKKMKELDLTTLQVAEKSGLSRVTIHTIVTTPKNPTFRTAFKICDALGIEIKDMIKD